MADPWFKAGLSDSRACAPNLCPVLFPWVLELVELRASRSREGRGRIKLTAVILRKHLHFKIKRYSGYTGKHQDTKWFQLLGEEDLLGKTHFPAGIRDAGPRKAPALFREREPPHRPWNKGFTGGL